MPFPTWMGKKSQSVHLFNGSASFCSQPLCSSTRASFLPEIRLELLTFQDIKGPRDLSILALIPWLPGGPTVPSNRMWPWLPQPAQAERHCSLLLPSPDQRFQFSEEGRMRSREGKQPSHSNSFRDLQETSQNCLVRPLQLREPRPPKCKGLAHLPMSSLWMDSPHLLGRS